MAKKWDENTLSCRGERGRCLSRGKDSKGEIFKEGPMTEGHLSERSFLELRGYFSILIQMREIGTKKILLVGSLPKMLTFF